MLFWSMSIVLHKRLKSIAILDFFVALVLIFAVWINGDYQGGAEFAAVYAVLKVVIFNPSIFDAMDQEK